MTTIATLICTMNRPDDLRRALSALSACDPPPAEIIVSDDSPEGDRRSEAACAEFPQAVYQRGPRIGLGANRNAAIGIVKSSWIHFIDDDVIVPKAFYAMAETAIGVAGGRAILSGLEMKHIATVTADGNLDASAPPVRVVPPFAGFWAHMEDAAGRPANCVVINAALFPRELLARTPFDERMKYGCEESDITCNAISQGYQLVFEPRLSVDHFPANENRSVYREWIIASQVYAGLKRQWCYQRSVFGTIGYLLIAVPRLILFCLRRGGPRAGWSAVKQSFRGVGYFFKLLRSPRPANGVILKSPAN